MNKQSTTSIKEEMETALSKLSEFIDKDSFTFENTQDTSLEKSLMMNSMKRIVTQVSRKDQYFVSKSRNQTPTKCSKTEKCLNISSDFSMTAGSIKIDPNETLKRMEEKTKIAQDNINQMR